MMRSLFRLFAAKRLFDMVRGSGGAQRGRGGRGYSRGGGRSTGGGLLSNLLGGGGGGRRSGRRY